MDQRITGDQSYRTLWHTEFAEKINFSTLTNGVISNYRKPEFRQGSLDVVNAAVNLAYIEREEAMKIKFNPEYFIKQ